MKRILFFALWLGTFLQGVSSASFSLYHLTCEQEENPLGIETPIPYFSWKIHSDTHGFYQKAYQIIVADSPKKIDLDQGNIWQSGKVRSSESILIPFGGTPLKAGTTYYWKARVWNQEKKVSEWSTTQCFTMGMLHAEDWNGAKWIALEKDEESLRRVPGLIVGRDPLPDVTFKNPQFRKEFKVTKEIQKAVIYVSGLGHFELFLNGQKTGTNFMDPGWTHYDQSILYVTFDVTQSLQNGANVLALMLGGGFYQTPNSRYLKLYNSFGMPKMKLLLQLEYADGTTEYVPSGEDWKTTESAITFSSIYGGEDYDASREQKGWMLPGYGDSHWNTPVIATVNAPLHSQRATPLSIVEELPVVRSWKTPAGNWVYDLGQNFSGIPRIRVQSAGTHEIKLYPAELTHPDGRVNQYSSGGPFWFSYTTPPETSTTSWQPQFTYYGFRYIEVEGAIPAGQENPENRPVIEEITGLHTCNSAREAGRFQCSNPLFNQTHTLIDWAMRSNMASVFTDCPHREKLGWLEEAYLMQPSLQYRYNLARLYEKVLADMAQAQTQEGIIPTIAPEYVRFDSGFEDTPEWGSAFIICPWNIYQWYGDRRLIERYYPQMKKYLNYLTSRADSHILSYGLGDWYDLGPNPPGYSQLTSNGVTATATYYYNTTLLQQMAALLGETQDEEYFAQLATEIRKAFNLRFFDADKQTYDRNSQTANAMALYFELVEPRYKAQILQNLIHDIRQRGNALTAGDVGYRYLLKALEANGCQEIIFDMNSRYDVPGYGYQLAAGATSLTESWTALGSSSNNHFMLGHLMEWLYSGLGGIRPEEGSVAFRKIRIDPQVVGNVRNANTRYESPYGTIRCEWELQKEDYLLEIQIPENCEAVVFLPSYPASQVTVNGILLEKNKEVSVKGMENTKMKVQVGSGTYRFHCKG